ncbi:SMI1/KNR4 family protein [Streptomyces sp. NRRL WC-3742]|uniref:SMI1/KNR4 family protein n=1 Tax=Streptomyces sp. NRRL WC-3742 TaxID=1463934 RepID=UPI0004C5F269|nr:SMI1/KNR4 family protein [Streptomyces sp. NRRL WC-3742]
MDDLAGTQAPARRLTDPAEAVAALEAAVPSLAELRLPEPERIDWQAVESELGTGLPQDYKLLCALYPRVVLGDFLSLSGPLPGGERAWAREMDDTLETVEEWCAEANLAVPLRPYPAPGGLLPWAGTYEGDLFLWSTSADGPQAWTVTVASRSSVWWHYTGGIVQFLADLASGAVEPWGLPRLRPEASRW